MLARCLLCASQHMHLVYQRAPLTTLVMSCLICPLPLPVRVLQEARNIEEFGRNFANDPTVKIPWVRRDLCGSQVVVMEWIEGIRCTDIAGIRSSGVDVDEFIR